MLRRRLADARIEALPYGEKRRIGDVTVSLHPAGHMLGSAQVRIEATAASGSSPATTSARRTPPARRSSRCAATPSSPRRRSRLPIFRWDDAAGRGRARSSPGGRATAARRASVLFCYALGKAQRLLAELARAHRPAGLRARRGRAARTRSIASAACDARRRPGRRRATRGGRSRASWCWRRLGARGTPWMRRFGDFEHGFASGLDAHARHAAAARLRPRLRALRSRRLAGAAAHHPRDRRRARARHARLRRARWCGT